MLRLLNVAVPAIAATVAVPLKVPLLGLVPIASVTLAVLVVALPNWSWIRTVTAGAMVLPANAFENYLRSAIFDGPEVGLTPLCSVSSQ